MSSLAVLVVNPVAGSHNEGNIRRAERLINSKGLSTEVLLSSRKGEIESHARRSLDMSPEMVFVMGGDGTFNEAANGLVHSDVPVAFIPSGTTNVLAKELAIPRRVESAVEKAVKGKMRRISLGNITDRTKKSRYFIMMAGVGYDADAVYHIHSGLKNTLRNGAYIVSGLQILQRYRPEPITIRTNGIESTGYTVIVGNGSCYGGRFKMTPDASLFSPYFYVFILKSKSRLAIVRTFFKLFNTTHIKAKDVSYFRAQTLSLDGSSHVQTDGDYLGKLPVDISVERECLNILN